MLAVVERSGLDESFHHGSVVACDLGGRVLATHGDFDRPFYVRSAAKPFQAAVSVELGADLPPEHLAVACASHDGDAVHVGIVREILAAGGLDEADLRCTPGRPLSRAADRLWAVRGSSQRSRIFSDCSGKHAAMLRACIAQDWDTGTYDEPAHPLQQAQLASMRELGGLVDERVGVDGCGVPVFRVSARSLAVAYARLLEPRFDRVWTAMHRFPALVSGVGNADTEIAVGLDAIAKRGAEGLLAVAVRGRGALIVRCWDGSERAVAVATLSALDQLGWITDRTPWRHRLERPVRGGGRVVGSVRSDFELIHT
jgi:L-asparaginase II